MAAKAARGGFPVRCSERIVAGPVETIDTGSNIHPRTCKESVMWTKPAFTDLRIGFEVTLYFANR